MAVNIFGEPLEPCNERLSTGYFRNGKCDTCGSDSGMHTVCAMMTQEFLDFSASRGNDLSTPVPEYAFPGLAPGDLWCVCLSRWQEAYDAGVAPPIDLEATHISVLEFIEMDELLKYAIPTQ